MEYLTQTCGSKDWGSRNKITLSFLLLMFMCNIRKGSSRVSFELIWKQWRRRKNCMSGFWMTELPTFCNHGRGGSHDILL